MMTLNRTRVAFSCEWYTWSQGSEDGNSTLLYGPTFSTLRLLSPLLDRLRLPVLLEDAKKFPPGTENVSNMKEINYLWNNLADVDLGSFALNPERYQFVDYLHLTEVR